MAETTVSHVTVTVTTVEVFIKTMQFIQENNLWDEAQAYLEEHGKTEMFIDYDVLHLFREMLESKAQIDPKDPAVITLFRHRNPFLRFIDQDSN